MRNIQYIPIALAVMSLLAVSCEDDRNSYMVDDMVAYNESSGMHDVSVFDESYELSVLKSGKGQTSANVTIAVADTALENYNARMTAKDAGYVAASPLASELYTISENAFSLSKSEIRKVLTVSWDASKVVSAIGQGSKAIPFKLFSTGTEVNADRDLVILHPTMTTLSMETGQASSLSPSLDVTKRDTMSAKMSVDIPVTTKDITVRLAVDNSLIDQYNADNSTAHTAAPDGLVSLVDSEVTIPAGESSVEFRYALDVSKFYVDGALTDFTSYIVPIRIKSTSITGLAIGTEAMYVPVVPLAERTLMGPWTVLEGSDLCYAKDEGRPNWAANYTVDRMVDGNLSTEWISIWEHDNVFPMTFVFDLGDMHLFKNFKIKDHSNYQGNLRDYEMYMATEYKGENTEWTLIAKGLRASGWVSGGGTYDFPVQSQSIGRYLKFVIVKAESTTGDYIHGRGKIAELYGEGL